MAEVPQNSLEITQKFNRKFCYGTAYYQGIWYLYRPARFDSAMNYSSSPAWLLVFKYPEYFAYDSNVVLAETMHRNKKKYFIGTGKKQDRDYIYYEFKDSIKYMNKRKELSIPDTLKLRPNPYMKF